MKALVLLLLPIMVFSNDTIPPEIKEIQQEILVKTKNIDSIKKIKHREIEKNKRLERLLREKVMFLLSYKAKQQNQKKGEKLPPIQGIKTEDYAQFHLLDSQKIELVPDLEGYTVILKKRKWSGRLFSGKDYKIKLKEKK